MPTSPFGKKPVLALTMGDPGGIGPEVLLRALQKIRTKRFRYLVIGARPVFDFLAKKFRLSIPSGVDFLDVSGHDFQIGKVSRANAQLALASLEAATELAVQGKVQAIVTAPVNKTAMRLVDPHFVGHTEYLARAAKRRHFAMMFVGTRLKVTLVTIHVPVKKVSKLITRENVFQKIRLTEEFLKKYFRIKNPRIAVCALNPHGRETGEEDEKEIAPAVRRACRKKINAAGPLSADQLFFDAYEGRFDAVISMYHDQGLAPFKMIAFRDGVNVTLGLPFIRTSPDHGTAFDIAYQGKADAESMKSALALAEYLCRPKSNS